MNIRRTTKQKTTKRGRKKKGKQKNVGLVLSHKDATK